MSRGGPWFGKEDNTARRRTGRPAYSRLLADAASVAVAFLLALELRFEFAPPPNRTLRLMAALPLLAAAFLFLNSRLGVYSGRWKFASFDEIWAIARATAIGSVSLSLVLLLVPAGRVILPLGVAISGTVLSLSGFAFNRIMARALAERRLRQESGSGKRVLLVGAGEAGEMIARDMIRNPSYDYEPVAFIDDDPRKRNLVLAGVAVAGSRHDIPRLARDLAVTEIFITMPSADGPAINEVVNISKETGAHIKILPCFVKLLDGEIGINNIRDLRVEDLLGREPVQIDLDQVAEYVSGNSILVTGAGGSIGSEISRQLSNFPAARLLFLDKDETALFNLEAELSGRSQAPFEMLVADVRDRERIRRIFREYRPSVVFHSAALKHVPMMEKHPCEAVKNNVMGTLNMAETASAHGCERFLMISTDKAVSPNNVMGATKRISEMIMKQFDRSGSGGTAFGAVRFGNVLGSRGSVVPTFKNQIASGGPLVVTHPDATRFFMTICEAAKLVMQACAFLKGSEIFLLDMGEPVRIMDLAEKMIQLLGNGNRIDIEVCGLRPGEKLHEDLIYHCEELLPTPHSHISVAPQEQDPPAGGGG
ncbi:MAG: polysaccharide biosynthesis protein, partial [Candidatus Geothermincolia bacterium]